MSAISAAGRVEAVAKSKAIWRWFGDLEPHAVVECAGDRWRAKDHRAVAVPRTRRPSRRMAVFVISRSPTMPW